MSKFKFVILGVFGLSLALFFQNCGKSGGARHAPLSSENGGDGDNGGGEVDLGETEDESFTIPVGEPTSTTASCEISDLDFRWPLDRDNGEGWHILKYFDLTQGPGVSDYNGGQKTSENFKMIEIGSPFIEISGYTNPVYSADAGTVVAVQMESDDYIMRAGETCMGMEPNFLAIEHSNGFQTIYYGLRKGSNSFRIGDAVAKGEVIGQLSSNGCSSSPKIQWELRNCQGEPLPIMANRESLFSGSTPRYTIPPRLISRTTFNSIGSMTIREFFLLDTEVQQVSAGGYFGMHIFVLSGQVNDQFVCRVKDANNTVVRTGQFILSRTYETSFWRCHFTMPQQIGNYNFEWTINGRSVVERSFQVTP